MANLTLEQRIEKAHVWLMGNPKYCLFSGIFMLGKVMISDTMPTAATNGRDVIYGRKFCDKLPDTQLRALILHENMHKAFRHLHTWRNLYDKDARKANMACDYVINLMIHDSDPQGTHVKLPECGLLDEQFRGMDAHTVFNLLPDDGDGGGMDAHDWDGAQGIPEEQQKQLERDVDQAMRQGALLAGKLKGEVSREVKELLTPKVDWRKYLRDFVTSYCQDKDESTWRRPSRRWVAQDTYMPSTIGESVGWLTVAVDTSGSIGENEIGQFLGEVVSICENVRPEGVHLLYWDTAVAKHEIYTQDQLQSLLTSTKPAGGGGTSPNCIPQYLRDKKIKAECCVVLTDGYVSSWGDNWPCPVLWGITTKNITADVGVSITIE